MSEEIFPLKELGDYLNKNYICLQIDAEKGEGKTLAEKFKVTAYPTFLVLDADGNEVNRIVGSHKDVKEFIGRISGEITDMTELDRLKKEYETRPTMRSAMNYLDAMRDAEMYKELATELEKIYFNMPEQDRYQPAMWRFVDDYVFDPESLVMKDVVHNRDLFDAWWSVGKSQVDKKLREVFNIRLLEALSGMTTLTREQVNYYTAILNMLEPAAYDRKTPQGPLVVARLMNLKFDKNYDGMLDMLENVVRFQPMYFNRIQAEIACSKIQEFSPAQKERFKAYLQTVIDDQTRFGQEYEALFNKTYPEK